jgi:protein phosphatase
VQDERGLALLTRDHSVVQLLVESGDITDEEARDHPARGRVTRFVGMPGEPLPEVRGLVLRERKRFLLCSDGPTGELEPEAIGRALSEECTPEGACGRLVDEALRSGGRDNVTVVVVDVVP